ncbi:undecaprenyl-phosphate glucose phosphotransferase [Desulfosarcina widdelii]|uniref:Undecaprenyl-phosphate glucose phosphotransferase n=1 Tax=Desulfosarcina widdelii TaxID=947919 RepID=A0A5K7Z3V1_9BACT|nr:undecaprenyl-phosphate glucose phosphotransferase [Desulfosarcina widdelii]BBO75658.1 undecaprenyl-phosphate glucose phosphotransferase [Desulfosarcina widdelii]
MENGNSRLLFITDLVIMFACFFFVFKYYTGGTMVPLKGNILMGLIVIYWFLISVNSNILRINRLSNITSVTKDILIAYSVLSTITIATVAIFGQFRPNDKLILYPLLFGALSSTSLRLLYMVISKHRLKLGHQQKAVVLIGSGNAAKQIIATLLTTPELGFRIQGVLSDSDPGLPIRGLYAGKLSRFPDILRSHRIDEVIIAEPSSKTHAIKRIIDRCEVEGLRFCIVPDFYNLIPKWTVLNGLGNLPVIAARNEPLNIFSNQLIKRCFDVIVSSIGLLALSPLFLIIGVGIKISSPGPILFRQKRIGNNNAEFTLFKFRSMIVQPPQDSDTIWTIPDDKRITPFGKAIRQTNLDELPQLLNVLAGDMSIVGPRPEREHFVEKFSREIHSYRVRHLVKSGITGLAQANGWRGNTSIQKRIENDLYYLEHWSLWLDLKIIFMTFLNREAWKNAI